MRAPATLRSFIATLALLSMAFPGGAQPPAAGSPPGMMLYMMLYKRLPLTGRVQGIVSMQCTDSEQCSIERTTRQVTGTAGTLEAWQDSRITPALRSRLWGHPGKPIVFGGDPARPALLVLRNDAGAIVAQSAAETALMDLEPLLVGAPSPTFLITIDYRTLQAAVLGRGILEVDIDRASLSFATFVGPKSVPVVAPDGVSVTEAVPGPDSIIAFDSNFTLTANAQAHSAELTVTGCYPSSYVNYRTRDKVDTILTVHARYKLNRDTWIRTAQLSYDNCGGQYPGAIPIQPTR